MIKHWLVLGFILFGTFLSAQMEDYRIVVQWDNMAGELNGILSGSISGEFAYVQGAYQSSALDGRLISLGETVPTVMDRKPLRSINQPAAITSMPCMIIPIGRTPIPPSCRVAAQPCKYMERIDLLPLIPCPVTCMETSGLYLRLTKITP